MQNFKAFDFPCDSGLNTLYNVLAVYNEQDQNFEYMQGMNYLAALILMAVDDEVIAFAVFEKIMNG